MSKPRVGKRYRVNSQGHKFDGQAGTLERIENATGWIMRSGELRPVPLACLTDKGVLQNLPEPVAQPDHFCRLFHVLDGVNI